MHLKSTQISFKTNLIVFRLTLLINKMIIFKLFGSFRTTPFVEPQEVVFKTKTEENMVKRKEAEKRRKEKEEQERKKVLEEESRKTTPADTTPNANSSTTFANNITSTPETTATTTMPPITTASSTTSPPTTATSTTSMTITTPVLTTSTQNVIRPVKESSSQELNSSSTSYLWNALTKKTTIVPTRPLKHSTRIMSLVLMIALTLPSILGFCCSRLSDSFDASVKEVFFV